MGAREKMNIKEIEREYLQGKISAREMYERMRKLREGEK
jgi:hypothetical protein